MIFLADRDLFVLINLYNIVPPSDYLFSQNVFSIFNTLSLSLLYLLARSKEVSDFTYLMRRNITTSSHTARSLPFILYIASLFSKPALFNLWGSSFLNDFPQAELLSSFLCIKETFNKCMSYLTRHPSTSPVSCFPWEWRVSWV